MAQDFFTVLYLKNIYFNFCGINLRSILICTVYNTRQWIVSVLAVKVTLKLRIAIVLDPGFR